MESAILIDELALHGAALPMLAEQAGLDIAVPGLEWDVRGLVTHVGGVHRWATDVVSSAGKDLDTQAGRTVGEGLPDDELMGWYRQGHQALVGALLAAPVDLDAATFLPADSPLHFWARRQAHETAMHRADAEAASGRSATFATAFAQDGIDEMLHGFAARRSSAIARDATLRLHASDGPSRLLRFGGERLLVDPDPDAGSPDATVSGTSSDLYKWVWNRPSAVQVTGDPDVAQLWAQTVRVTWG